MSLLSRKSITASIILTISRFGAVLERFEVEDAIMEVVTAKATSPPQPSADMEWELVSKAAQS